MLLASRLLSPSDFGLVDMCAVFIVVADTLAEFGIGTAVMQMPELDRRAFGQLHTASIVLGAVVFACSILAAPAVADFFHSDKLESLVVIYSITFLITGFQAVPLGLLQRDMDYRRLSVAEAIAAVSQAVALSVCALLGLGYWALIAGALANKVMWAILTAWWKPVHFAVPRVRDIMAPLRLGWHVMVGRVVWVAFAQMDAIVLGRMMGSGSLGCYRMAINLASAPAGKIGMLIMRVSGPLFANIQNDRALVQRYFMRFTDSLALSIGPLALGMAAVAPDFVVVVLGPKWAEVATPLRWLAIFAFLKSLDTLAAQVLTSLRHTRFTMWISILNAAVMAPSFLIASRWGPGAVAATWVIMAPATMAPQAIRLFRAAGLPTGEYFAVLGPALVSSAGMVAAVLLVAGWLPMNWPPALHLAVQVAAGGVAFIGILLAVYRNRILRYVRFLRQLWEDRAAHKGTGSASSGK